MTFFWNEIKKEKRPIVIYGTGDAAEKTFNMLKERGIRVMAFSSSTEFLRNRSFLGYKVLPLERIKEIYGNDIVLLLGFGSHEKAVIDHIIE
ncbi:MAG: nucleoside-diphosphate sugar epimerase/dehydratase, partial [Candidatus Ornithospirochaeta sp.]